MKNPFFMESHGECGMAQIGLRRSRRDSDDDFRDVRLPRIVAGRDALVGEVLDQGLVFSLDVFKVTIVKI